MDFLYKRAYRGPLKAVILDWAGTTIDYGCMAPVKTFLAVFLEKNLTVSEKDVRRFMGTHKRDHIKSLLDLPNVSDEWRTKFNRMPTENDVDDLFKRFLPLQLETLKNHSQLIPGVVETISFFKERKLKIGTTTGYTKHMMEVIIPHAKSQGYQPDFIVCADEVPQGRPSPFMCFENMKALGIYPLESVVKMGDTPVDIEEGLNASVWTIGIAKTGNEFGLSLDEERSLSESQRQQRISHARNILFQSGAHYVVDHLSDVKPIIDDINQRLSRGERP